MTYTLTALFKDRAEAVNTTEILSSIGIPTDQIHIMDQNALGYNNDQYYNTEDVQRGGFLLTAHIDEAVIDDAINILGTADTVDINEPIEK